MSRKQLGLELFSHNFSSVSDLMVKHLGSEFQIGHCVSFSESNVLSRASMSHGQLTTMDIHKMTQVHAYILGSLLYAYV